MTVEERENWARRLARKGAELIGSGRQAEGMRLMDRAETVRASR